MELKYNKKRLDDKSPILFINEFVDLLKTNKIIFEFSIYQSGGQGITVYRHIKKIEAENIQLLSSIVNNLKEGEELALNSRVTLDGKTRYIPMCDFSFKNHDEAYSFIYKMKEYLNTDIYLYKSGRSYHMYAPKLLTIRQWAKFNGYLLLMNTPNHSFEIVDSRWVGHSLEQGFGALRITCNSNFYMQAPTLLKIV